MDKTKFLKQFDAIDIVMQELQSKKQPLGDGYFVPDSLAARFVTICNAYINRIAGPNSTYAQDAQQTKATSSTTFLPDLELLYGVVQGLQHDISSDSLATLSERIHANLFEDFLERATYLLEDGDKDTATVLAGGVLEEHLRQLCRKNDIPTDKQRPNGIHPKMGADMNSELAKANVYDDLQKNLISTWLTIRNKSAHGEFNVYTPGMVKHFIDGLREFINRFPA